MGRKRVQETTRPGPLVVDPRWLLRAGLLIFLVALLCGYGTLCLLFYQGQWQMALRPEQTTARPATLDGRPYDFVRFGPDSSGVPQRTAWFLRAGPEARYRHLVLLYLPSGEGSLNDARATLDALGSVGIGVFAINYRGYGESLKVHPSEQAMREDAEAAWSFLVQEQHVSEEDVIPYGAGVGAALALRLAIDHKATAAMVLDGPRYDVVESVKADPRVRLLPVELLLHDRFPLEPELSLVKVPKLIVTHAASEGPETLRAADPKMTVAMPRFEAEEMAHTVQRFLDTYAPPTPEPRLVMRAEPARENGAR